MWPECGPKAARMRPEFKILRPEISPCKFPVARAQPGLKLQARNPTRTMKKVARPSPNFFETTLRLFGCYICFFAIKVIVPLKEDGRKIFK